ncbi:hypothetical protein B0J12DRAFT_68455, partial [Macrophomina phaseolina]
LRPQPRQGKLDTTLKPGILFLPPQKLRHASWTDSVVGLWLSVRRSVSPGARRARAEPAFPPAQSCSVICFRLRPRIARLPVAPNACPSTAARCSFLPTIQSFARSFEPQLSQTSQWTPVPRRSFLLRPTPRHTLPVARPEGSCPSVCRAPISKSLFSLPFLRLRPLVWSAASTSSTRKRRRGSCRSTSLLLNAPPSSVSSLGCWSLAPSFTWPCSSRLLSPRTT